MHFDLCYCTLTLQIPIFVSQIAPKVLKYNSFIAIQLKKVTFRSMLNEMQTNLERFKNMDYKNKM